MTGAGPLPSPHLFRVSLHVGVWRLIHNGVFYRDYATEADAVAAAHAAADKERAFGHTVQVVTASGAPLVQTAPSGAMMGRAPEP